MKRFLTALPFVAAALIIAGWFALDKLSISTTEIASVTESVTEEPASEASDAVESEAHEGDRAETSAIETVEGESANAESSPEEGDELPRWKRVALERQRQREANRVVSPRPAVEKVAETPKEAPRPVPRPSEKSDRPRSSSGDSGEGERPRTGRGRPGSAESKPGSNKPVKIPKEPIDNDDPSSDREAPEISTVEFIPTEIQDGQSTTIVVTATDNLSGVRFVTGTVRSPGGATLGFSTRVESPGRFSGSVQVPQKSEEGEWYVFQMRAMDQANNVRTLSWTSESAPPGARFRVMSNDSDSEAPVVTAIRLDQETVGQGESNNIHIEVTDDKSGVQSVYGLFASPSGSATAAFNCRSDATSSTWSGQVILPANADCGEWKLRQVTVSDKANNRATVSNSAQLVGDTKFFLSFGGNCDSEPPVVTLVDISPAMVSNETQNQVQITVWVQDNSSGVQHVGGRFIGPRTVDGQPPYLHFSLKEDPSDSRAWKGSVTVPRFAAKGMWSLQLIQVVDKASNRDNLSTGHPVLAGLGITVE